MRNIFPLFLLLFIAPFSNKTYAQTKISGIITNPKLKPLLGASITIKDSYDGATSNEEGRFSFTTTEQGTFWLEVTMINSKKFAKQIVLNGSAIELQIILKDSITELTAVVLSAGSFEASDKKRSAVVLDPIDIVTTASANGDITGALKTLPGAQQVGESEGLYVRGGTAQETKFFIDGSLVNKFFYSSVPNIAQFGRFSPFIFKGTVFSTGGYSALYGQALSSAVILESIDLPPQSSAQFGVTVLSGNAGYQHLAKNKKSSFGGSYNYSNLGLAFKVIKQKQDYSQMPVFHNADANFRIKTSPTGMIKYYGYYTSNKLGFTSPSIDSIGYFEKFDLTNSNHYHNLSYKEFLGNGWRLNAGVSYAKNIDAIAEQMENNQKQPVLLNELSYKNFKVNANSDFLNAKLVLEKRLSGLSAIRFGGEYNFSKDSSKYTNYNSQAFYNTIKEKIYAAFAETDVYLTNHLALKVGGRYEYTTLIKKSNISPRFSLSYKINNTTQLSAAYGIFYQNPERALWSASTSLHFAKATHYILQFQRALNSRVLRAEIYYKKYDRLIKTNLTANNTSIATSSNGNGNAKGIEIFWRDKKTIKNFDYWISYSYLDTKRDFLNFPYAITPNYAAKHTGSIVTKKFIEKLKLSLNTAYNYSSRRPYYRIATENNEFVFTDRGRIPDYHNISFAINYLPFIGRKNTKVFDVYVLQVSNIFNFKQTYGYNYSHNGIRKEAIVPPSRVFVFLGAFITLGVDRSEEIMNNNL